MKNIIVGILTLIIIALMGYTASKGGAWQGGEAGKITENVASMQKETVATPVVAPIEQKSDRDIENEKLKSLKDKAGNAVTFKVSDKYKQKCASCHGAGGEGIVGLPLFGQSAESIYEKLIDFKSGKRQNPIMKGAIMNIGEADFKELAQEISEFKARAEALKQ
ncbi:MAG: c-type cytochrome [Sulfurospirillaceae bacterium]|nr:c-type cytochrome [Sulfurospirillaceae bacterium]MDD2827155.1 c-type cytochrome [Sulfurospirillaceae bacterium]